MEPPRTRTPRSLRCNVITAHISQCVAEEGITMTTDQPAVKGYHQQAGGSLGAWGAHGTCCRVSLVCSTDHASSHGRLRAEECAADASSIPIDGPERETLNVGTERSPGRALEAAGTAVEGLSPVPASFPGLETRPAGGGCGGLAAGGVQEPAA